MIGVFSSQIVTKFSYVHLACAAIHVATRMTKGMTGWSTYMSDLTRLRVSDFEAASFAIAKIYVKVFNEEVEVEQDHCFLIKKFSHETLHHRVAKFDSRRVQVAEAK